MKKLRLTKYEKELRNSIEKGEWKTIPNRDVEIKKSVNAALTQIKSMKKDARVSLRLNTLDIELIRDKAAKAGLPYQTLIASIIHQYATNQIIQKT